MSALLLRAEYTMVREGWGRCSPSPEVTNMASDMSGPPQTLDTNLLKSTMILSTPQHPHWALALGQSLLTLLQIGHYR